MAGTKKQQLEATHGSYKPSDYKHLAESCATRQKVNQAGATVCAFKVVLRALEGRQESNVEADSSWWSQVAAGPRQ